MSVPQDESTGRGLDARAFETLVQDQTPSLYRFALTLTREPHAAGDLVQESFLRAWRDRTGFRGTRPRPPG